MNLWGPVGRVQRSTARFYLRLAEKFRENAVIRDTWGAMARDLDEQAQSLKKLRPAFWNGMKKEEKLLLESAAQIEGSSRSRSFDPRAWPLHACLVRTLELEELIALKLYAPLIYRLRSQAGMALDFYVIVNAHLTRLARLIQPFSGDPALIQRCNELLQKFEKEAQAPESLFAVTPARPRHAARAASGRKAARVPSGKRSRAIPVKRPAARGVVKNLKLSPRRARR